MAALLSEARCDAGLGELVELGSCDKAPMHAKAQRVQGGIAEIVRSALAADGMPIVASAACTGASWESPLALLGLSFRCRSCNSFCFSRSAARRNSQVEEPAEASVPIPQVSMYS